MEIVKYPAAILEKKCKRVTEFGPSLKAVLNDMYKTMQEAYGVGLAAPQVGIGQQIAVVDIGDGTGRIDLVNPKIIARRGEQTDVEGCLSFPGVYGTVSRAYYVKVKAQNAQGKTFIIEAEDFLARALQHEIDHLHGVLFTSKIIEYVDEEDLTFEEADAE
ncbi:peptide deformylase [Weizmannia acidilactici]|mgnify:CR=1 FL=1|uniref:peptide deformylase n=1 Tax=Weizmannia acidilactici TaxID=2607726 RepID=UPI00124F6C96|nr:peptide deformylase [Weizmannia acidilactici]GER65574.1 peptide deformylase [Weizmannia acidilactici]GER74114.1 peptide deformylase [Weizmannia acidilactici]